nr:hypothetical protein Iba_chr04aCG20800 [Ipomoea batatas]
MRSLQRGNFLGLMVLKYRRGGLTIAILDVRKIVRVNFLRLVWVMYGANGAILLFMHETAMEGLLAFWSILRYAAAKRGLLMALTSGVAVKYPRGSKAIKSGSGHTADRRISTTGMRNALASRRL